MKRSSPSAAPSFPPLLWHYTTFSGLKGILKGTIWASSLACLNDTQEFRYAIGLAQALLNKSISRRQIECDEEDPLVRAQSAFDSNRAWLRVKENVDHLLESVRGIEPFVACFSEKADDLSQWRAYGYLGPSFALGFDRTLLEKSAASPHIELRKVVYDQDRAETLLKSFLRKHLRKIPREESPLDDLPRLPVINDKWPAEFAAELLRISPRFKHPTFDTEQEWRLIYHDGSAAGDSRLPLQFRQASSLIVPYVEIPLQPQTDRVPISEIIVGPSPHPEELVYAIEKMVAATGDPIAVRRSQVPFRNW